MASRFSLLIKAVHKGNPDPVSSTPVSVHRTKQPVRAWQSTIRGPPGACASDQRMPRGGQMTMAVRSGLRMGRSMMAIWLQGPS